MNLQFPALHLWNVLEKLRAGEPLTADAATWASKPWHPLPVHGIPGWWAANEAPDFYADTSVFRRPRRQDAGEAGGAPANHLDSRGDRT